MNFKTRLLVLISCTLAVLMPTQFSSAQPVQFHPTTPAIQNTPSQVTSVVLRPGEDSLEVAALQKALVDAGWPTWIDGDYGPHTQKTVEMYQRANGLFVDGIAGPQTLGHLNLSLVSNNALVPDTPPIREPATVVTPTVLTGNGCDVAKQALYNAGATQWEADFGTDIAYRESRCTLSAVNQNSGTRDNSWGPWQINYYGDLYAGRVAAFGPPESNTSSWERAAANFLKMGREYGWCHWQKPNYCAG